MKIKPMIYLEVGFVAGIFYLVACGGSSSGIASAIGNAIDVLFDNTASKMVATNAQAAIDELAYKNPTSVTPDMLVGTWTGLQYGVRSTQADISTLEVSNTFTITFNVDGTYTCSGIPENDPLHPDPLGNVSYPFPQMFCSFTNEVLDSFVTTWRLMNGNLKLYISAVYMGLPSSYVSPFGFVFPVDSTSFILNLGASSVRFTKVS
jgi:hypothetical protein